MLTSLEQELQPLWLGRDDPSVAFSLYGKAKSCDARQGDSGDVNDTMSPLYRYNSPEIAHVHPWTPTTLEIRDLIEAAWKRKQQAKVQDDEDDVMTLVDI